MIGHANLQSEGRRPDVAPLSLSQPETVLTVLLFGILAGANGVRFSFNSGVFCGLLAVGLLALRLVNLRQPFVMSWYGWSVSAILGLWFVGAVASTAFHASNETILSLYAGYFVPLLIYASLVNRPISESHRSAILLATAVGAAIPWSWGLVAYFNAFGIPSMTDLLWNRYDIAGMTAYHEVAFGNTSHMALYISVLMPPILVMAASTAVPVVARYIFSIVALLAFANMLIVFSRATFLTILLVLAFWMVAFRSRRLVVCVGIIFVLSGWGIFSLDEASAVLSDRTLGVVSGDAVVDPSVNARVESIIAGWKIFAEHPLVGVGPGMTYRFNEWSIAHQISIEEAASIGIAGFISTTLLAAIVFGRSISIALAGSSMSPTQAALWSGILGWVAHSTLAGGLLHLGLLIAWAGLLYGFIALTIFQPRRG